MTNREKEVSHEYTNEIVCPWCGYEMGDSFEMPEDGEEECSECEKTFSYCRNVSVSYSTNRKQCDKCKYELDQTRITNPYIYKGKNWCLWRCKICHDEQIKTGEERSEPYIIELEP
jgi:hypothetical protein